MLRRLPLSSHRPSMAARFSSPGRDRFARVALRPFTAEFDFDRLPSDPPSSPTPPPGPSFNLNPSGWVSSSTQSSATSLEHTTPPSSPSTSPLQSSVRDPPHITQAIDIGSNGTRSTLFFHGETPYAVPVTNCAEIESVCRRYETGDFSSRLYPFEKDRDDIYRGEHHLVDAGSPSISAKYVFYELVQKAEGMPRGQCPKYAHIVAIENNRKNPDFKRKLRLGLVQLLETVRDRGISACAEDGAGKPNHIVLSIPATWKKGFMDLYSEMIIEVFGVDRRNIDFIVESEAFMHAMIRDPWLSRKWLNQIPPNTPMAVSIIDGGGHNTNVSSFYIFQQRPGEEINIMELGESSGAIGGSELWEDAMEQRCLDMYEDMHKWFQCEIDRDGHERLQAALDQFNSFKRSFNAYDDRVEEVHNRQVIIWAYNNSKVEVDRAAIQDLYHAVMDYPLEHIRQALDRFDKLTREDEQRVVLVTGGTSQNPGFKQVVSRMCEERHLPVKFTRDLSNKNRENTIANGAAYAAGYRSTPKTWFSNGGCIALQIGQFTQRNKEVPMDEAARLLYSLTANPDPSGQWREFPCTRYNRARLVANPSCTPWLDTHTEGLLIDVNNGCYDLTPTFSLSPGGLWRVRATWRDDKNILGLEFEHCVENVWCQAKPEFELPLFCEIGSNCLLPYGKNVGEEQVNNRFATWDQEVEKESRPPPRRKWQKKQFCRPKRNV